MYPVSQAGLCGFGVFEGVGWRRRSRYERCGASEGEKIECTVRRLYRAFTEADMHCQTIAHGRGGTDQKGSCAVTQPVGFVTFSLRPPTFACNLKAFHYARSSLSLSLSHPQRIRSNHSHRRSTELAASKARSLSGSSVHTIVAMSSAIV
jgi:hypothetical protein